MGRVSKGILKFVISGLVLVAVAVGVLFLVDYIRYRKSPEYRVTQELKELERRYREDPYGGTTPEETLQLFIDALEKGDIELASRYFLIEEQPKWRGYLQELKEKDNLESLIREAKKLELTKKVEERAFFVIADEKNIVEVQVVLGRNVNGRWKVLEL